MNPILRSPRRVLIDTAGKWRELVVKTRWGHAKGITALAERWTTSDLPEVEALLSTRPETSGFVADEGLVGDRDIDLIVDGKAGAGRTLLGVVGVGVEPLGPSVAAELRRSLDSDRLRGGPPPVDNMARRVFNVEASVVGELRFGLLRANSALLREAEARRCAQAVLIIHELRSPLTVPQVRAEQQEDIQEYLLKLSHRGAPTAPGALLGPAFNLANIPLYAGRAVFDRGP